MTKIDTFDWNNDGKTDATDDFLFLEVISKDDNDDSKEEGSFPTLGASSRYSGSSIKNTSSSPTRRSNTSTQIGGLTKLAIAVTILLCISALFMGYGHIFGDLLGLGFLGCLFAHWLEK